MGKAKIKQYATIVYHINKYLELYPNDTEILKLKELINNIK